LLNGNESLLNTRWRQDKKQNKKEPINAISTVLEQYFNSWEGTREKGLRDERQERLYKGYMLNKDY
jgi:hypothetical protein